MANAADICTIRQIKDLLGQDSVLTNVYAEMTCLTPYSGEQSGAIGTAIFQDDTGRLVITLKPNTPQFMVGERLFASIFLLTRPNAEPYITFNFFKSKGMSAPPVPTDKTLASLDAPENNLLLVRVSGTIVSISDDEIDANYLVALLKDGSSFLPLSIRRGLPLPSVGSTIRVTGFYHRAINGVRKFSGPYISPMSSDSIEILRPAPSDPFSAPPLDRRIYLTPREVIAMGPRTVSGVVVARWGDNQAMLEEPNGRIVNITLASDSLLPAPGETGIFVGHPSTDLFRINLTHARFKRLSIAGLPEDKPETIAAKTIVAQKWTSQQTKTFHGRLLRLTGTVRSLPLRQSEEQRLYLDCDTHKVPVDISSCRDAAHDIPIGSEVEVTGRCYLDIDNWQPDNIFPHIRRFILIARTADDIRVTKYPPWWTPTRLMMVIGVILAALIGSFVWVFTLHRLAERRGHALYRARQAQDAERRTRELAELRMQDRTRLAVELHDTISQNLTGATMQMGTAVQLVETDHVKAIRHLDIATRTLDACREELRNCIWDLRNNALDVPNLNDAIRMTLQRLMGGVMLQIRFNIPREKLSDNTVHALMRIVRELATNAVRHGAAKTIRIAGALDNGILSFSVTDDGKGFDPKNRPGLAEGHFGLQGVEERVEELGGEMKISSKIGKGTRVKVWIKSEC